ncbi:hypothetical protein [Bradyrhizobium pachyrhizi]|uniref:hypothetical protein n=1 Tax=Bradyrhizobium pachyrhizi TaxID=280333 RepID=UPI00067A7518|nr:hypothetical protein [Bradyrhizobium pachyrhizi]
MVLDGVDATGKSSLCKTISEIYIAKGLKCKIKTEFSSCFVGRGIEEIVAKHRFFRLDQNRPSPIADLAVILADVFCKYEIDVEPTIDVAVMERGVISALAYQLVRLNDHAPEASDSDVEKTVLDFISSLARFSRWPDCHFTLNITQAELERRIVNRDETPLRPEQAAQLMSMQRKMIAYGPSFRAIDISVDGKSIDELAAAIIDAFDRRTFGRR